jgi:hypothetical protein
VRFTHLGTAAEGEALLAPIRAVVVRHDPAGTFATNLALARRSVAS